jgi:hypothetical protein
VLQSLEAGAKRGAPRILVGAGGAARLPAARGAADPARLALWLRASLNEGLLGGRLAIVAAQRGALAEFYEQGALLLGGGGAAAAGATDRGGVSGCGAAAAAEGGSLDGRGGGTGPDAGDAAGPDAPAEQAEEQQAQAAEQHPLPPSPLRPQQQQQQQQQQPLEALLSALRALDATRLALPLCGPSPAAPGQQATPQQAATQTPQQATQQQQGQAATQGGGGLLSAGLLASAPLNLAQQVAGGLATFKWPGAPRRGRRRAPPIAEGGGASGGAGDGGEDGDSGSGGLSPLSGSDDASGPDWWTAGGDPWQSALLQEAAEDERGSNPGVEQPSSGGGGDRGGRGGDNGRDNSGSGRRGSRGAAAAALQLDLEAALAAPVPALLQGRATWQGSGAVLAARSAGAAIATARPPGCCRPALPTAAFVAGEQCQCCGRDCHTAASYRCRHTPLLPLHPFPLHTPNEHAPRKPRDQPAACETG